MYICLHIVVQCSYRQVQILLSGQLYVRNYRQLNYCECTFDHVDTHNSEATSYVP